LGSPRQALLRRQALVRHDVASDEIGALEGVLFRHGHRYRD
jgi:hypothetical protein